MLIYSSYYKFIKVFYFFTANQNDVTVVMKDKIDIVGFETEPSKETGPSPAGLSFALFISILFYKSVIAVFDVVDLIADSYISVLCCLCIWNSPFSTNGSQCMVIIWDTLLESCHIKRFIFFIIINNANLFSAAGARILHA